jgi:hypothetical protein
VEGTAPARGAQVASVKSARPSGTFVFRLTDWLGEEPTGTLKPHRAGSSERHEAGSSAWQPLINMARLNNRVGRE